MGTMTSLRAALVAREIAAVQERPEDPAAAMLLRLADAVAVQAMLIELLRQELAEVKATATLALGLVEGAVGGLQDVTAERRVA
jgi:hypothetical protein